MVRVILAPRPGRTLLIAVAHYMIEEEHKVGHPLLFHIEHLVAATAAGGRCPRRSLALMPLPFRRRPAGVKPIIELAARVEPRGVRHKGGLLRA